MIYLDNAATTKPCKRAEEAFNEYNENFFNPSSIYINSIKVARDIANARATILCALGDASGNLVFTSGATEANNLAFHQATKYKNKTILVSMGEHPSVYNPAKNLQSMGYDVRFIKLNTSGEVDTDDLKANLSENVGFVSIMMVNNETGAINPIKEISSLVKSFNPSAIMHVDAVQGFTKLKFNVLDLGVDLLTISSHKVHGLKGTGALYFRDKFTIKPQMLGGGQEFDNRSGTENVGGIIAFKEAVVEGNEINPNLRKRAVEIISSLDNIKINGNGSDHILNVSALGVKAEVVVRRLEMEGILVSTGSACNSHKADNRILSSMGVKRDYIEGTNRFSFSKYTTMEEVETAFTKYVEIIKDLRTK